MKAFLVYPRAQIATQARDFSDAPDPVNTSTPRLLKDNERLRCRPVDLRFRPALRKVTLLRRFLADRPQLPQLNAEAFLRRNNFNLVFSR
jgi:hypothetical protein